MKSAPARESAFGALLAVERGAWSAEAITSRSTQLTSRDAGLASDIAFGVLRRRGQLDAIISRYSAKPLERLDTPVRVAIEMGLYQMLFLDRVPDHAAVSDSVELVRRAGKSSAASMVNAILRRASREHPTASDLEATPAWLMRRWIAQFGEAAAQGIAETSLRPPERFIRVPAGAQAPQGGILSEVPGCYRLPSGDSGPFRFQDIGSQAVVPLLDLQPGQSFLDLCAAPGNKTAQAIETSLRAVACDLHLSRARTLHPLGVPVAVLDATNPLPFRRRFDRILVDAPCSGTGTLSRNPEIKWRLKAEDIADLAARQTAILRNALDALASDGILVYSTCSLEREENEDIVAMSGARVLGVMQRIPGRDSGDGFFAAALQLRKLP